MSPDPIQHARQYFFSQKAVPGGLVPQPILRSWTRCRALGLEGRANALPEPLTAYEFALTAEESEAFKRLCRPEVEALYADAQATGSIVILTNASGLVLDTIGSLDFARHTDDVARLRRLIEQALKGATKAAELTPRLDQAALTVRAAYDQDAVHHCAA